MLAFHGSTTLLRHRTPPARMVHIARTVLVWCWLGLLGCASPTPAGQASAANTPALAAADKAQVYILRPDIGYRGVARNKFAILLDNTPILALEPGEYTLLQLDPFEGRLAVECSGLIPGGGLQTEMRESTAVSFQANNTYYVAFQPVADGWITAGGDSYEPVLIEAGAARATAVELTAQGPAINSPL